MSKTLKPVEPKEVAAPISSPSFDLIAQAVSSGQVDVSVIEKLVALQNDQQDRQAKADFYHALSGFQSSLPVIAKQGEAAFSTRSGGSMSYKYARLEDIDRAIRPHLVEFGLSYRFETDMKSGIEVRCIVTHKSGHSVSTSMSSGADTTGNKNGIQQIGSTLTYLQRYTLIAALGITTADSDQDGMEAQAVEKFSAEFVEALPKMIKSLHSGSKTTADIIEFVHSRGGEINSEQISLLNRIEETLKQGVVR